MSHGAGRIQRASGEFAERIKMVVACPEVGLISEDHIECVRDMMDAMWRARNADTRRLRLEIGAVRRTNDGDTRRLREAMEAAWRMNDTDAGHLREAMDKISIWTSDPLGMGEEIVRSLPKMTWMGILESAWRKFLAIRDPTRRVYNYKDYEEGDRTTCCVVSLGRCIPGKFKAQIVGDILEDCDDLRRNGRGEWGIRIHALREWAGAVITSIPGCIVDTLLRAWKPSQGGNRSQE